MQATLAQLTALVSQLEALVADQPVTPVELLILEEVYGTLGTVLDDMRARASTNTLDQTHDGGPSDP